MIIPFPTYGSSVDHEPVTKVVLTETSFNCYEKYRVFRLHK